MKISILWLREWVNPKISNQLLSEQLTMAGLEVETMHTILNSNFSGVVIGEIIDFFEHPNMKSLKIVKIHIGHKKFLTIVVKTAYLFKKEKIVVATIGAHLPKNLTIKLMNFNGVVSEGKICSFYDLNLLDNDLDIIKLSKNIDIGQDFYHFLKKYDISFKINITPNRADCLSILGLSREVSAINNIMVYIPKLYNPIVNIQDTFPIYINNVKACPRYLARILKGISVDIKTPVLIRKKLQQCDINLVNIVIDLINYVMLELGQPINVFDINCLDSYIKIRMSEEKEIFELTNQEKIQLKKDTLIITDRKKILAIAGIKTSEKFNVKIDTCNILIESAFFNPKFLSGKMRDYNIKTEAGYRYERGIDPEIQYTAIQRITFLLLKYCGGNAGPIIDIYHKNHLPKKNIIILRRQKLNDVIGYNIDDTMVQHVLKNLGFHVSQENKNWIVTVPSWRFDVNIEEDLIEEVLRMYGYENIPKININYEEKNFSSKNVNSEYISLNRAKTMLIDRGYQEVITYSFVNPKYQSILHPGKKILTILNPISVDMSAMRLSLWAGLLSTLVYNQNRKQKRIRLFESGFRFIPDSKKILGVRQEFVISGVLSGIFYDESWNTEKRMIDFYDLKGDIEALLELTNNLKNVVFKSEKMAACHPKQTASIYLHEKKIGVIAVIDPKVEKKLNLKYRTLIFEILWNKISKYNFPNIRKILSFPTHRRDISIIVPNCFQACSIIHECKKIIFDYLIDIFLFDVYHGTEIKKNHTSLSIALILQGKQGTLTEEKINMIVSDCIFTLEKKFQVSLRKMNQC